MSSVDNAVLESLREKLLLESRPWIIPIAIGLVLLAGLHGGHFEATPREGVSPRDDSLAGFQSRGEDWRPVLWPLDRNPDRVWKDLSFSEFHGLRAHLAVLEVSLDPDRPTTLAISTDEVTGLLIDGLRSTNRFVVEPERLEGSVQSRSGGYLIAAHLSGRDVGDGSGPKELEISVRVVDEATGQVRLGFESSSHPWGLSSDDRSNQAEGSGRTAGRVASTRTILEAGVNQSVFRLARWFEKRTWHSVVTEIESEGARIGAGRDHGLEPGMVLRLLAPGEPVIDPEGGQMIGSITRLVGRLRVLEVGARDALVEVTQGGLGLKVGHRVELESGNRNPGN